MTRQVTSVGTSLSRSFEDRLGDFAPELASFLRQVWAQRAAVVGNALDLYDLYSGTSDCKRISLDELQQFFSKVRSILPPASIFVQDYPRPQEFTALSTLTSSEIKLHRHALAARFYHFINAPGNAFHRIYVHSQDLGSGLEIIDEVVSYFSRIPGILEAKIIGPAITGRADTIVIYLDSPEASDELLAKLLEFHKCRGGSFAPGVPALVKEVVPGIGTSSEPPKFEIQTGGGTRHSFGTFYCDLIYIALKNTPNVGSPTADGRHLLDNLLWSLRLLGIQPRDHLAFPDRDKLEAYQAALNHKPALAI